MAEVLERAEASIEEELEKVGTARGRLRRKLEEVDPEISAAFNELTPKQKMGGELVGKIIAARSWSDIAEAFDWYRVAANEGIDLSSSQKKEAILVAYAHGSPQDKEASVRILGKLYLKAMFSD